MYRSCLARQINEVESLQSMFCGQNELTVWNELAYDTLKRTVEGKGSSQEDELPQVAFQLQLPLDPPYPEDATLVIRVKMPPFYPSSDCAEVHINGSHKLLLPSQEQDLRETTAKFVESKLGQECVLDLVQFAKEWIYDNAPAPPPKAVPVPLPVPAGKWPSQSPQTGNSSVGSRAPAANASTPAASASAPASSKAPVKPKIPEPKEQDFRRILIWFSTIAPDRAKTVAEWAKQLGLTGLSRLGSPALLVVEGLKEDVDEYVSSLRSYRWKKMDIVWEEKTRSNNINACRRFTQFQECMLPLQELQPIFKKAGLEDMYKEGLKIRG